MHGKVRQIAHTGTGLFKDISSPMNVTRYHSLLVERSSLPLEFLVDAESQEGEIMAISHRTDPIWGVQFHPEAILTDSGLQLLANAVVQASLCETFQ
jgi:anthranilate/para-aminobenzoate synthase component II